MHLRSQYLSSSSLKYTHKKTVLFQHHLKLVSDWNTQACALLAMTLSPQCSVFADCKDSLLTS